MFGVVDASPTVRQLSFPKVFQIQPEFFFFFKKENEINNPDINGYWAQLMELDFRKPTCKISDLFCC